MREGGARAPRISFAREVEVCFEDFGDFVTEYSRDLSQTGMFLHTTNPHPPGSSFQFEFRVAGDRPLIRGVGEVVWTRARSEAGDQPPGMGVRFVSVDGNGRKLIRWLIDRSLAAGDPVFEPNRPPDARK